MTDRQDSSDRAGRCECGAVRYRVAGPLRPVLFCHCGQCRRSHGHTAAYTAAPVAAVTVAGEDSLAWYRSSSHARRGFCRICGSSLFWAPDHGRHISIAAGTFDQPSGLVPGAHVYYDERADYEPSADDLPKYRRHTDGPRAAD